MSRFNITAPDGRVVVVEGDDEPTDEEAEEIFESLPKVRAKKESTGFEPTVMRSVVSAMQSIVKKLDDISTRPVKPPVVNVEAPKVTVEAPEVNVTQKMAKRLRFRVTDRDEFGRIKDITVTVLE